MPITPTQGVLVASLAVAIGYVWYVAGRGRWRARLADRFVLGIPWGTLVTVAVVVAFYLAAQGGLRHWEDPLIVPYVSWSYFYSLGMLSAGIAHGSPAHLLSNMTGTLALAPIAEYAWGHYPPSRWRETPGDHRDHADGGGVLANPWIRAVVVFPTVLLAAAVATALFALGPGLGFSGALFAIAGFAVVNYPVVTLLGIVLASGLRTLYAAVTQPVVRETLEAGPPSPPPWAGIGFQAHILGFLLGVIVGLALLRRRRRAGLDRVFAGTLLFGLVLSLWLIVWSPAQDVFVLYRGAGVVFVIVLTVLVAVAVAGSRRPLVPPGIVFEGRPTRRQLAVGWLAVVTVGFVVGAAGVLVSDEAVPAAVGVLVLLAVLLAIPVLPAVLPDRVWQGPLSRRQAAALCLAVVTVLVAAPSVPFNLVVVDDPDVPRTDAVTIDDYSVTYAENATSGHGTAVDLGDDDLFVGNQSGVIVISDDREIWFTFVHERVLAHEGNATVEVGGLGWRETVEVRRAGWDVVGNGSAYVVDLEHDNETTRAFESEPATAHVRLEGHEVAVVPAADAFRLSVSRDGEQVGETAIPALGESATVGDLRFTTEPADDDAEDEDEGHRLVAETDGTRVQIAAREVY